MRKGLLLIGTALFTTVLFSVNARETHYPVAGYYNANPFIFQEQGITFAVYPDGEFDFYMDSQVQVGIGAGNVGVTFNSGFNYNPFIQYDHYGAVIQVEHVPIFYDPWGRVDQIGNVNIFYRNGWVYRIGGLTIFYNNGVFSHTVGFINIYNRRYVFRPWHRWFARPAIGFCNVWTTPYRRWYDPIRYTFFRPYIENRRVAFYTIGSQRRYAPIQNRNAIYRNDRRVSQARSSRSERYQRAGRSDYAFNDSGRSSAVNQRSNSGQSNRMLSNGRSGNTNMRSTRNADSNLNRNSGATRSRSTQATRSSRSGSQSRESAVNRSSRSGQNRQGSVNTQSQRNTNQVSTRSGSSRVNRSATTPSRSSRSSQVQRPKSNRSSSVKRSSTRSTSVKKSSGRNTSSGAAKSRSTRSNRSSSSRSGGRSSSGRG